MAVETRTIYEIEDVADLHALYQTHWWFAEREPEALRRAVEHSDEFVGLRRTDDDRLVASARVITDYTFTGKILDVIVAEALRGEGLGRRLMAEITHHPRLRDVDELTLNCRGGVAPFYESCGFRVHEMIEAHERGESEAYYVMVHS